MLVKSIILVWFVIVLLICVTIIDLFIRKKLIYPFQNYGITDIPYVTIDIQGTPLNLLVDTGCGVSIMSKSVIKELSYESIQRKVDLAALTEDSISAGMVKIKFNIGNRNVEEDFVVYSEDDIACFQKHYNIQLHGILGNEFLDKLNCKIDYKKHALII